MFHFYAPLKTSENLWYFDVFRVYRNGTLASNRLSPNTDLFELTPQQFFMEFFGTRTHAEAINKTFVCPVPESLLS